VSSNPAISSTATAPISHVVVCVGKGLQVAATHTGSTVKRQSAWEGNIVGFTRPTG
jgi:hypothetical protein